MRLTRYTDFSLRVLIYLALRGRELSTIQQITDAYGISRNHLMKVVQHLVHQGYVESVRGQRGGLRLRRAPDSISLGQVVRDMEPDAALVECFRTDAQCVISPGCTLPAMFNRAIRAFYQELDQYTLADIVTPAATPTLLDLLELPAT